MNKPAYLRLSVLDISKKGMHKYWFDYLNPKYGNNGKLSYMDTDSLMVDVQSKDLYADLAEGVKKIFDSTALRRGFFSKSHRKQTPVSS